MTSSGSGTSVSTTTGSSTTSGTTGGAGAGGGKGADKPPAAKPTPAVEPSPAPTVAATEAAAPEESGGTYLTSTAPVETKGAPVWVIPGILLVITSMLALLGGLLGRSQRTEPDEA